MTILRKPVVKFVRDTKLLLIIFGLLIITWPTVVWYQARMLDGSDNNWGLMALLVAIVVSVKKKKKIHSTHYLKINLGLINLMLLVYIVSIVFSFYTLIQMMIVTILLSSVLSQWGNRSRINFGIVGLMLLSLPLFASLDFYLGYPLRYFIGLLSSYLLNLHGLGIRLEGVSMLFDDKVILIDGPCSGIKMMWTGSFLTFSFIAYFDLNLKYSIKLSLISFAATLTANVFRICALFYVESDILGSLKWMHETVGIVCYSMAVAVILYSGVRIVNLSPTSNADSIKRRSKLAGQSSLTQKECVI